MNKIRPRFPNRFAPYLDRIKLLTSDELESIFCKKDKNVDIEENENGITIKYIGGEPITSKEQAIDFFNIDTKKYAVAKFQCKSWTTTMKIAKSKRDQDGKWYKNETPTQATNYGITLTLEKKPTELILDYKINPRNIKKTKGAGNCVLPISDFHIGSYVGELLKTKDFSFDIICGYLETIAKFMNEKEFENIHLMLLGDFIESFTGLNHINSWKGLHKGSYGMGAVILAHEILSEHLYSKLNNLKTVDFVSGNHDRITSNNKEDVTGEVGKMLHYLFTKDFKEVDNSYSDLLVRRKVDGVGYLSTHGHLGLSKKDTGKIVQDYGFSDVDYHVVLQGHKHTRETIKSFKKHIATYEDIQVVQHDSLDYRKITIPPLFTGNFYSESLGYTSTAGFTNIWKNQFGKLNHLDITI